MGADDLSRNKVNADGSSHRTVTVDQKQVCWDARTTETALRCVVAAFERDVPTINALNVFPVPDGDTGTNMHLTLHAVCQELDSHTDTLPERVDELFKIVTRGALMGARGNSGVILYQIIAGLSAGADGAEEFDGSVLARGFDLAAEMAYRAVNNPVEGTMLSVIKAISEACHQFTAEATSILDVLSCAQAAAHEAVEHTPDQLPVLRQAGVVDAGGKGLLALVAGLESFAKGELDPAEGQLPSSPGPSFATDMHFLDQAEVIHGLEEFGYCINFAVTGEDLEDRGIRQTLDAIGTSTVIVGDDTLMKIHTHSEHPGTILEAALTFGELHEIRIDNMKSQTERLLSARQAKLEPYHFEPPSDLELTIGVVAVGAGSGIVQALQGMGAQAIVSGGTSMNPSTGEIRNAIESLEVSEVIVLPNDSNILASARHAANMSERDVRVVPTTSIQQGIAALAAFNFEASLDENAEAMAEASQYVRSLAVTRAQRDATIEGLEFRAGEYMGILDGVPRVTGPDAASVTIDLLKAASGDEYELATFFVGASPGAGLIDEIEGSLAESFPDLELEIADGGQPHYDLLISLE